MGKCGEKMEHKTFVNRLLIALLTIFAMALLSLSIFLCRFDAKVVAIAQDKPSFTVRTENNYLWELLKDDVVIMSENGPFFDTTNEQPAENVIAVKFANRIRQTLLEDGVIDDSVTGYLHEYYDITFEVPTFTTRLFNGINQNQYTESDDSRIVVMGDFSNSIATKTLLSLQYSEQGEGNFRSCDTSSAGSGLRFGQYVPVGVYDVRMLVVEQFEFDGAERSATHYGSTVTCEITMADAPTITNATKNIVYGEKLGDISSISANIANKYGEVQMDGRWVLSATQTDEVFGDGTIADKILPVRDEAYTVMFDFEPTNKNYEKAENIAVSVNVSPRSIFVYIGDAYSLVGEDLADISNVEYKVYEDSLADCDTIDDLNLTLVYEDGINKDVAGQYLILATSDNTNYIVQSRNMTSHFVDGGRYRVYETKLTITASDGFVFEIYCGDGFVAMNVTIERIEVASDKFGANEVISAYKITFLDYNRNEVLPTGEFTIAWTADVDGATWVCKDENEMLPLDENSSITLAPEEKEIYFVREIKQEPIVIKGEVLSIRNIVLLAVCGALAICIIGVVLAYANRRRYLK